MTGGGVHLDEEDGVDPALREERLGGGDDLVAGAFGIGSAGRGLDGLERAI